MLDVQLSTYIVQFQSVEDSDANCRQKTDEEQQHVGGVLRTIQ